MATVKMKLLTVTGDEQCFDEALGVCVSAPAFHVENAHDIVGAAKSYTQINRFSPLMNQLDGLASAFGLDGDIVRESDDEIFRGEFDSETFSSIFALLDAADGENDDDIVLGLPDAVQKCKDKYNSAAEERNELANEIRNNERVIDQLNHLKDVEFNFEDLFTLEFFRFRFGHMPKSNYETLEHYKNELNEMFCFNSSTDNDEVWLTYFTPVSKSTRIDNLFASLLFERVRISDEVHGTPGEATEVLKTEIREAKQKVGEISLVCDKMKELVVPVLAYVMKKIREREDYFELRSHAVFNKKTFCITGWVPAEDSGRLEKKLEEIPSVACVVENPIPNRQTPPTLLKNPKILKPFEEFVNMYGLPSQGEIDPTPIVAVTYFIFFGLMFGDLGQGILLIMAGFVMYFVKKMWLGGVIAAVGVSSSIFGAIYGSVFGFEDIIHGFNTMENINITLFAAIAIGVVMIIICMILNIINGIRQKDIKKIFFSPNGVFGLILYASAVIAALGMFGILESVLPAPVLISLIVIMLLLIFLADPLCKLIKRRSDWMPEGKLDFILENFFELFEVVLSYLTNTISFIRIGAFALSHVGMMTVIFLLAGGEHGNPVIIIVGNLFVTGFEGLIVGIQVLRLEFYELFGRFYSGDGRSFENCTRNKELK